MELYNRAVSQYLYLIDIYKLNIDSDIDKVFKQILDLLSNEYNISSGE